MAITKEKDKVENKEILAERGAELMAPQGTDDEGSEDTSADLREALGTAGNGSAQEYLDDEDDGADLFGGFNPDDEDDVEADRLNDPSISHLDEPPVLGGRGRDQNLFGNRASTPIGRAISPRLYAQASQFPTCTQLRIWKWENGVPVGLGAIDAMATEEDLVREFSEAMPKRGEGRCQFKMRPIDINGHEMGQEVSMIISEHHAAIQKLRRMREYENEESNLSGQGSSNVEYITESDSSAQMAEQMSRMMERMMDKQDSKTRVLEEALEAERDRIREQDFERAQERVDLATNAAQGVQVLTERMMADESRRSSQAMEMQQNQSQTLVTTLSSIFAQQQTMMQGQSESQRRADQMRLEQERQRSERERRDAEDRRQRERLELEERRRRERDEHDRKMKEEREYVERKLVKEHREMELRMQRERDETQMRMQRDREEREGRERWLQDERSRRDDTSREESKSRDLDRQRQHERKLKEADISAQRDREHAERMMVLSRQELQGQAMGGLTDLLPKAVGFLQSMGMEPQELMQKFFAPPIIEEEKGSAWSEAIPKLLGVAGEVASAAIRAKNGVPPAIGAAPPYAAIEEYPDLPEINDDIYKQHQTRQREKLEPSPIITPPPPSLDSVPEGEPVHISRTSLSPVLNLPSTAELAQTAGLDLLAQKKARTVLGELLRTLANVPQEQWSELITGAITQAPEIYTYLQAVSVKRGLAETGAPSALVSDVIQALKGSPIIPSDLNYGDNQ
jgi:hypothetical protein